ncbi:MAG: dihydropteroate synthase [Salinivirgaceae bacterium]|jgi:dihydropteroate synthase|nr:dihydropteroate synthase [Salinivirgaceae bacterium]
MIQSFFNSHKLINCRGKLIDLSKPKVMGIMNITPDSFYNKSRFIGKENVAQRAKQIIEGGGDIIDIGAYSSRPGAEHINEEIEWNRLAPALEVVRVSYPDVLISVDTFRSGIAKKAVTDFDVDIINDISAGSMDETMFATIAELKLPYIIMHMQGTPQTMQEKPSYEHLMREVFYFFAQKIAKLKEYGIADIIIDPGFGFGKTLEHNYEILSKLDEFKIFELPVLVGLSRKSMVYKFLKNSPDEALNGTTALNTISLVNGANILRVHDVKEAVESVKLFTQINHV